MKPSEKPLALELAERLEGLLHDWTCAHEAAAELRRLHALVQELEADPAPVAPESFEAWWDDPMPDGPRPDGPVSRATAQWIWDAAIRATPAPAAQGEDRCGCPSSGYCGAGKRCQDSAPAPVAQGLGTDKFADLWVGVACDNPPSGLHEDGLIWHRYAEAVQRACAEAWGVKLAKKGGAA